MQVHTKLIVLSALKYGDSSLIVKAYTASDGLKSYLLKGVLGSRKGKLKAGYFQPLTQLDVVASHRNKGNLEHLREVRVAYPYQELHARMDKKAIGLFLAELLGASLREEEPDPQLFNFLEASLQWLDTNPKVANFHLLFMLELSRFLGFYPSGYQPGDAYFDLEEGMFLSEPASNQVIQGENFDRFVQLLGTKFEGLSTFKMNKANRSELLQDLIRYYEIHLQGFRKPKSLAILHELFN